MVGLGILLLLWAVVGPLLALVIAVRARDRAAALERRVQGLERGVPLSAAGSLRPTAAPAAAADVAPAAAATAPPVAPPEPRPTPPATVPAATVHPAAAASAATPPRARAAAADLEERIGVTWFTRIGAAVLILGALYFFKYAVDNQWIGPWGRVALGVLAGAALVVVAERQSGTANPRWVQVLLGVGVAVLYVAAYATYGFYRLLPEAAAFAALVVVAVLGGALALRHNAQAVLLLALAGALAAPRLLAGGEDRGPALFAYLLLLAGATAAASLARRFAAAPWVALAGTAGLWLLWWESFFRFHPAAVDAVTGAAISGSAGAYHPLAARAVPLVAVAALAALWAWTALRARTLVWEALQPAALAAAALLLGTWATGMLLADRPAPAAAAMVLWAAAAATLADRGGRSPRASLVAALAALPVLLTAAPRAAGAPAAFVTLAGAWAGFHLATGWRRLLPEPKDRAAAALALAGPLGFVGVALAAVPAARGGLRAVLAAAAGAALFALGAALLRRRPESRAVAAAMLGGALGVITLALALAFSGVTVTLLWAVLAAVVAALAAQRGDAVWLGGAAALFVLVLARVLTVDAAAPGRDAMLYVATCGAEGRLVPLPLINPRSLALLGVAAALGVAAWRAATRSPVRAWSAAAGVAATVAHALLAALVILEVRSLVTALPAIPAGALAAEEFDRFIAGFRDAVAAQGGRRAVSATLALGAYGGVLLSAGFAARSVLHRWLGLAALGVTLGKLVLWDIWNLPRLFQVLVLVAVGALLLGAGFLYARFGRRLLGLLKGTAVAAALLVAGGRADALEATRHAYRGEVVVPAAGYAVLAVTPALYHAAAHPDLADLRVVGPDGAEVPWVLRDVRPATPPRELAATVLDPVALPDGAAAVTLDLGDGGSRHDAVRLEIEGEPFLREATVAVRERGGAWGEIGKGVVYRVGSGSERGERVTVAYPASAAPLVRVTLSGAAGREALRLTGGTVLLQPPDGDAPTGSVPLAVVSRVDDRERRRTVLTLDAGAANVPIVALRLATDAPRFSRRVTLEASERGDYWAPAGGGVLYRAGGVESLRIAAATTRRHLRVVIDDGDDAPLPAVAVTAEHRLRELVLAAAATGPHALLLGRPDVGAPRYELAEVLAREEAPVMQPVVLRELAPNPAYAPAPAPPRPWSERHRVAIGVTLAALLLAMAAWAVRSLRSRPVA